MADDELEKAVVGEEGFGLSRKKGEVCDVWRVGEPGQGVRSKCVKKGRKKGEMDGLRWERR